MSTLYAHPQLRTPASGSGSNGPGDAAQSGHGGSSGGEESSWAALPPRPGTRRAAAEVVSPVNAARVKTFRLTDEHDLGCP
jgi:hypothetical protein